MKELRLFHSLYPAWAPSLDTFRTHRERPRLGARKVSVQIMPADDVPRLLPASRVLIEVTRRRHFTRKGVHYV
jgi:hypothetical protein